VSRPAPRPDLTIDELPAEARSTLTRLDPRESLAATAAGGLIVDIRSDTQRAEQGALPGARVVARNVLEWRFDARTDYCDPVLIAVEGPLILMCAQGFQSSLAAANLQRIGVAGATDMIGGFEAWRAQGLPVLPS
jgi:rhodanese-related sulfurtransferase